MLKRAVWDSKYLKECICEDIDVFSLKVLLCKEDTETGLASLAKSVLEETRQEWTGKYQTEKDRNGNFAVMIASVENTPWVLRFDKEIEDLKKKFSYPIVLLMPQKDYVSFAESNPVSDSIAQLFSFD